MKALEFCYWLQGFAETTNAQEISPEQWEKIKKQLKEVTAPLTQFDMTKFFEPYKEPQEPQTTRWPKPMKWELERTTPFDDKTLIC